MSDIFISKSDYMISVLDATEVPQEFSEVVFMGRSNVGKSSLLNALTNKKGLAKKSQTPGKTRTINFFNIEFKNKNKEEFKCYFVDLPGFGYARVSKSIKSEWSKYLNEYIEKRNAIRVFVYLVDPRHPNLQIDNDILKSLSDSLRGDQMLLKVYTKSDKLNQSQKSKLKGKNNIFISSTKLKGMQEVNQKIFDFLFTPNLENVK